MIDIDKARLLFPDEDIISSLPSGGQKSAFIINSKNSIKNVLKVYHQDCRIDRVFREIQAMTSLNSQYIAKLSEFNTKINNTVSITYSIEEYIEGATLSNNIRDYVLLNETELSEFLIHMLEALILVNEKKLVHRDIKPDNII